MAVFGAGGEDFLAVFGADFLATFFDLGMGTSSEGLIGIFFVLGDGDGDDGDGALGGSTGDAERDDLGTEGAAAGAAESDEDAGRCEARFFLGAL